MDGQEDTGRREERERGREGTDREEEEGGAAREKGKSSEQRAGQRGRARQQADSGEVEMTKIKADIKASFSHTDGTETR